MHFNAKTVTIPFFRVGEPPVDLPDVIKTVRKALEAQKGGAQ